MKMLSNLYSRSNVTFEKNRKTRLMKKKKVDARFVTRRYLVPDVLPVSDFNYLKACFM